MATIEYGPGDAIVSLGVSDDSPALATIGLIGGMSWRSTALYYERLNLAIERRSAGKSNARVIVGSVDYASLLRAANAGRWDQVEQVLVATGKWLERSGCSVVALTAVTAHLSHAALQNAVGVNVPHVLDATVTRLDQLRATKVGVLGTSRTCSSSFVREKLAVDAGREVIVVSAALQDAIDQMIHQRLSAGQIAAADRDLLWNAIDELRRQGAQAVLLACTELPLLLPLPATEDGPVVIDTVALHVQAICNSIFKARDS